MEFRRMRLNKQGIPFEKYESMLRAEERAVLALNGDDGYPFACPVNFYYDKQGDRFVLHGAKSGYKVDAIKRSNKACLCIYEEGSRVPGARIKRVRSVIANGEMRFVADDAESMELARMLCSKWESGEDEVLEDHIKREFDDVLMMVLEIEHMTGKIVVEG